MERVVINNSNVGERIKLLRTHRKISQQELAHMLCVSRSAICKIETGENGISCQTACELANIFDVSIEYILLGKSEYYSLKNFKFDEREIPLGPLGLLGNFINEFAEWEHYQILSKALMKLSVINENYQKLISYIYKENKEAILAYQRGDERDSPNLRRNPLDDKHFYKRSDEDRAALINFCKEKRNARKK